MKMYFEKFQNRYDLTISDRLEVIILICLSLTAYVEIRIKSFIASLSGSV